MGRPAGFLEDKPDSGQGPPEGTSYYLSLIPYEETTTYRQGTRNAPEAIVDASSHVETYDETLKIDASKWGIETLRPDITDLDSITRFARSVRTNHPDNLLGFVGGEHSITPSLIEGCCSGEIGIVWIDAHADLRESYRGRKDNHACAGFNSMPYGPIVQVGIRTLAEEEARLLESSSKVQAFAGWTSEALDAVLGLPRNVYLTVDADGFAPGVVRAVGTPEPGGLEWAEVIDIVATLFREKNVVAFDTVELCPDDRDIASTFTIAKLIYKIFSYHAYHHLENG